MISSFFAWLGRQLYTFFTWLGDLLWGAFKAVLDALGSFFDYLYQQIIDIGGQLVQYIMAHVPSGFADNANFQDVITFIRSAWVTFDVFVPLSEGLVFVTLFFSFYFVVKLIQIMVRVILAIIP